MSPKIFGIRIGVLGRFYGWRLREHGAQELFATAGIAVGVALVFGVLVANASLTGSAKRLLEGIQGASQIQLAARSPDGYHQRLARRAARLPGVLRAAPVLRANVALVGPHGGRSAIQLIGATKVLPQLGGALARHVGSRALSSSAGLTLPMGVARTIDVHSGEHVTMLAAGRVRRVSVVGILGSDAVGSLAESRVGIAPLEVVQAAVGQQDRITQLLVQAKPSAVGRVSDELELFAGGRLSVLPADAELSVLTETSKLNGQVTSLFAFVSAMVGILLALHAMLLTSPERRRFVLELRMQGFEPRQLFLILGFEALVLGTVASASGLALGIVLAHTAFDDVPTYLAFAFPVGAQRIVSAPAVLLTFGAGLLVAFLAFLPLALDLTPGRPFDAVFRRVGADDMGESMPGSTARALFAIAVATVLGSTVMVLITPSMTLLVGVALALGSVCFLPGVFLGVAFALGRLSRRSRGTTLPVAVMELRATTSRSIALAGVAALAVYGSVALEGAHRDLVRGLDRGFSQFLATADLWITTGGDDLTTDGFDVGNLPERVAGAPGVAAVRPYQGGLLDVGGRRLWVIARAPNDSAFIPASQLREGDLDQATRRIRGGGWASISDRLARSRELRVGDRFTLPTPTGPMELRVAAITMNLGWPPGGIVLNAVDYRRAWATDDPTALQVELMPGVSPSTGKRTVMRALGSRAGALRVQTSAERRAQYAGLARQGLVSLAHISTLLLIAAALAVAAALGAAVWQRRAHLATLRIHSLDDWLWRSLVLEGAIALEIGCAVGAVLGVYGHVLANRYLELTTGFSAPFSLGGTRMLVAPGLVTGVALLVVLLSRWLVIRRPKTATEMRDASR